MPEEQLLQRRRLAGQRGDPVRPELGEQRTDPLRRHLATQSVPVDLHSADPWQAVERRWGGIQRHVDARVGDVAHLGERAGLDIAAVPDDAHPIAQRLHLRQDVAAQEHRPATLPLGLDALREDLLHQGIQPDGWLVEDEQLHVASQRCDQRHLLPIAFGVGGALLGRVQLEALQHLIAARAVRAATESAEEVDHLTTSELGPQVDLAGDVGEPAVERGRVGPRIAVEQPSAAGGRPQQPQQDADGGGFPGAVRPEKAMDLSLSDGEVQTVERAGPTEVLHQPTHADHI